MSREAVKIAKLLRRVGQDTEAPVELFRMTAALLRARQPLPDGLADYIAGALAHAAADFEAAPGKRIEEGRIERLSYALGMTRNAGRPRADVPAFDVMLTVGQFGDALSENVLSKALAEAHGVSLSTARKHIKAAKVKLAAIREGEGRSSVRQSEN